MFEHSWGSPGDLSEPSCSPPGGSFGGHSGFFEFHKVLTTTYHSKKVGSFSKLRHGHLVHTFFISFYEPSFLNTFMPATIPKVHHKICIHEDGKKKWGGGGAPLGQSIKLMCSNRKTTNHNEGTRQLTQSTATQTSCNKIMTSFTRL